MENYFTIGETAQINQIPIKTLRYYDEIGLLKPAQINEETGYRYYTPEQFYLIDIIKYGKRLKLPLVDIKKMMKLSDAASLRDMLALQKARALEEISSLKDMIDGIGRTMENIDYVKKYEGNPAPYRRKKEKRYALVSISSADTDFTSIDMKLKKLISIKEFQPYLTYKYGFLIDTNAFKNGNMIISGEYIELTKKPDFKHKNLVKFYGHEYTCFQYKLVEKTSDPSHIIDYINKTGYNSEYILADELLYSEKWEDCIYEICFR